MFAISLLSALTAITSLPSAEGAIVNGYNLGSCNAPIIVFNVGNSKNTFGLQQTNGYNPILSVKKIQHPYANHSNISTGS